MNWHLLPPMGEARNKSRSRAAVLVSEPRCIYCTAVPAQLEHMPPRAMFRNKLRPSGMEFATCAACNNGTSAADLVASFIARTRSDDNVGHWQVQEALARRTMLEIKAPGVLTELSRPGKNRDVWRPGAGGLLARAVEVDADGPLLHGYLSVFAAKLGMALYREHVGHALPPGGAAYAHFYLNAGLAQEQADALLKILPVAGTLTQGRWHVRDQFVYRYNCDDRSIVAALAQFHQGLFVFTITTAEPEKYPLDLGFPTAMIVRPGKLADHMPPGERYWSS